VSAFDAAHAIENNGAAMNLGRSMRKILVMGLPGAGKTTLARELAPRLRAPLFNADEVRASISRDLGFSIEDRIEHARRMGWLCDRVVEAGGMVVADFVCPTRATRRAFGPVAPFRRSRDRRHEFDRSSDTSGACKAGDPAIAATAVEFMQIAVQISLRIGGRAIAYE
jgi:adenylylsulfate kinase-like enzyme